MVQAGLFWKKNVAGCQDFKAGGLRYQAGLSAQYDARRPRGGAAEISFRLQLGEVEAESLTLTNGKLLKEQQKCGLNALTIPPCGPGRLCKVSAAFYMFNLF